EGVFFSSRSENGNQKKEQRGERRLHCGFLKQSSRRVNPAARSRGLGDERDLRKSLMAFSGFA
ncbi:MAG: hypothetical protein AB1813_19925, partial [Verrucomicrobiota bacterium]